MKPAEIILEFRAGSPGDEAWEALEALVLSRATKHITHAADREDARQNVLLKFVQQLQNGTLTLTRTDDGAVVRYIDRMLRNGWYDAHRAVKRHTSTAPETLDATADPGRHFADAVDEDEAWRLGMALVEDVVQETLDRTEARYREGRTRAFRQIRELFFEETTVAAVVTRDEGLPEGVSPAVLKRSCDAAMKNHQRAREALVETARTRHREGRCSDADLDLVERVALEFRRR